MNAQPIGAGAGILAAMGVLLVASALRRGRIGLAHRLAPYVHRRPRTSALLRSAAPTQDARTVCAALLRSLVSSARLLERFGSSAASVRRRLERAGGTLGYEELRLQQLVWAGAGLAVTLGGGMLLALVRPVNVPALIAASLPAALAGAGQGRRAPTRIAASDPRLWAAIVVGNAGPVAGVLRRVREDLDALIAGVEAAVVDPGSREYAAPGGAEQIAPGAVGAIADVMGRGNAGRARIPGKHGGAPRRYAEVQVLVPDSPGELGRLFSDVGAAGVNVEDFSMEHSPGQSAGLAMVSVLPAAAAHLEAALDARGWRVVVG